MVGASRGWVRAGGAGGVLFVAALMLLVSVGPLTNPTPEPAFDASSSAFLAYARTAKDELYPLALIAIAGMFGFLLFASVLITRYRDSGRVSSVQLILVVLATGVFAVLWLAEFGISFAGLFRHANLDATSASILYGLANGVFVVSWAAIAGFLGTAGIAALASRALPRWLAWSAPVIGAGMFLNVAIPLAPLWYLPYFLFYAWVLAVSVVLLRS